MLSFQSAWNSSRMMLTLAISGPNTTTPSTGVAIHEPVPDPVAASTATE
jgi:hypothetical protein